MPLSDSEWTTLIGQSRARLEPTLTVQDIEGLLTGGNSGKPMQVICTDQMRYALKLNDSTNPSHGRTLATEQVVGRLGQLLGAPTVQPARVLCPQELLSNFVETGNRVAGLGHASRFLDRRQLREDRGQPLQPVTKKNREDHARLGVLYGWIGAGDHQVLRDTQTDEIFSHDHGLFLPGGGNWGKTNLIAGTPLVPDPWFLDPDPSNVIEASMQIKALTDAQIAGAIAYVDASWGVGDDDLIALANYLSARRDML